MSEKRDNFEDLMSEFRRRFSDEAGSRSDFRDLVADMMDAQNLSQHGNKIIANPDRRTCESYFGWTRFIGGVENPDVGIPLCIGILHRDCPLVVIGIDGQEIMNEGNAHSDSAFSTSALVRTAEAISHSLGNLDVEDGSTALKKKFVRKLKNYYSKDEVGLIHKLSDRIWEVGSPEFQAFCQKQVLFSGKPLGTRFPKAEGDIPVGEVLEKKSGFIHQDGKRYSVSAYEKIFGSVPDSLNPTYSTASERTGGHGRSDFFASRRKVDDAGQKVDSDKISAGIRDIIQKGSRITDGTEPELVYQKAFTRTKQLANGKTVDESLRVVITRDDSDVQRSIWAESGKWRILLEKEFKKTYSRWLEGGEWKMKSIKAPHRSRKEGGPPPNIRWKLHEEILSIMEGELLKSRKEAEGEVDSLLVPRKAIERKLEMRGNSVSPARVSQIMGDLHALKIIQKPHRLTDGESRLGYRFNGRRTRIIQDDEEHYLLERLLDNFGNSD